MDNTITACPLCGNDVPNTAWDNDRIYQVECRVCGTYRIGDLAIRGLSNNGPHPDLSGVVRHRSLVSDRPPLITAENYKDLKSSAPGANDVPTKLRYFLRYVAYKSCYPGGAVEFHWDMDYPICFGANSEEFRYFIRYAVEAQYLADAGTTRGGYRYSLTPKGWEDVQRIPTLESSDAFVAMSFSKKSSYAELLRRAFEDAIKPAIENDAGYRAVRIDQEQFLGDIVFEIIARMRASRFIVADVTEHKNGVYFEAGYGMGMGLPVIWMCHKDDLEKTHFDTRQLNHIVWTDDLPELRKNLGNRILATIGRASKHRLDGFSK